MCVRATHQSGRCHVNATAGDNSRRVVYWHRDLPPLEAELVGGGDSDAGGLGGVVIADLGLTRHGVAEGVGAGGEPVGLAGDEGMAEEVVSAADGDAVGGGVDGQDVEGVAGGDA